jgi:prepilin-type N-terminal cleavage/methylation domain-containing protein
MQVRRVKGFTLVELLLVLVIIAVCTGGVAVSLKGRQEPHALKVASRDLAEAIRYAAGEAGLTGLPHRVAFTGDRSYRVEKLDKDSSGEFVPVTGTAGRQRSITGNIRIIGFWGPDGQMIAPVPECLVFDQTPSSFSGQIQLQGMSSQRVAIYVNGISGQVEIEE